MPVTCAISNATIIEGDKIVAYKMKINEQQYYRPWFIYGLPIHGKYDGYGEILDENDIYYSMVEDDLMIMHHWAWEHLLEVVDNKNVEEAKCCEEGGYTNFTIEQYNADIEAINFYHSTKDDGLPDYYDLSVDDFKKYTGEQLETIREKSREKTRIDLLNAFNWFGEGNRHIEKHWKKNILNSDDPIATYDKFYKNVFNLYKASKRISFKMQISDYAQDYEDRNDLMVAFYKKGIEFFEQQE